MPIWIVLLFTGAGFYILKEKIGSDVNAALTPPVKAYSKPSESVFEPVRDIVPRSVPFISYEDDLRSSPVELPAPWPSGDICESAINGLPNDKLYNPAKGAYVNPSIRDMALKAAKEDDTAGLLLAADTAERPEYLDAHKFAASCLRKRAKELGA